MRSLGAESEVRVLLNILPEWVLPGKKININEVRKQQISNKDGPL